MSTNLPVARRAGTRQGLTLLALGSLPAMAIAALVSVLPTFIEHFATAPHHELLVPMILTMPSLCVALCAAPLGVLADRWGRRPVLLLSLIAFTAFGTLPMLFESLPAIVASRAIVGLGEAGILTVSNALMGDYFRDERRRYWLGLQVSIGPFVGSGYILLGGALASVSWRGPFLVYALGAIVLVASYLWMFEPERGSTNAATPAEPRATSTFPWPATLLVGITTVLVSIVFFLQAVQHGRIFSELGVSTPARISLVVTIASMGTVLGGFWFKSSRPRPVTALLAIGLVCYGVAYTGVALAPNYVVGLGFDALGQFGSGIVLPTLIAWALSKYAFEHRGRGMGIWAACFFLGQFFSPPTMTLIAHGKLSFLASVGVLGALCLAAAVPLAMKARSATSRLLEER